MTKHEVDPVLVPISERADLIGLCRSYEDVPHAGRADRMEGDSVLLRELQNLLAPHRRPSMIGGPGNMDPDDIRKVASAFGGPWFVGDLSSHRLREAVERTEDRTNGTWRLEGEGDDLMSRIDQHFMPLQQAWLEDSRERQRRVDAMVAANAAAVA